MRKIRSLHAGILVSLSEGCLPARHCPWAAHVWHASSTRASFRFRANEEVLFCRILQRFGSGRAQTISSAGKIFQVRNAENPLSAEIPPGGAAAHFFQKQEFNSLKKRSKRILFRIIKGYIYIFIWEMGASLSGAADLCSRRFPARCSFREIYSL